ncbi:MAG: ribosome recycling factor [Candidatus Magasanikbacteria bacterium]|nr:ribosome recycling factor [Candidatus Magasanikbacteria bacterium]
MNLADFQSDFTKVIEFLTTDIATLRTGRASVAMVEGIMVEAYGTKQPLKAVASLTVTDPKSLALEPWDKSIMAAVENGIRESSLGINPVNDGRFIRLTLPELTSERRAELVKVLHQKLEQARIALRKVREEVRELIASEEKDKSISEDAKFRFQEELDKMVKGYNEEIQQIGEGKEKEIMQI